MPIDHSHAHTTLPSAPPQCSTRNRRGLAALFAAVLPLAATSLCPPARADEPLAEVRFLRADDTSPRISDAEPPELEAAREERVRRNVARLRAEGRLIDDQPQPEGLVILPPTFKWPIQDLGSGQFSTWAISNFVDQDPTWPNHVEDYACGSRTYDTNGGYNHTGIDIYLTPFAWRMKDKGKVAVVAASGGQIVDRADGNPDESCSLSGGDSNTIVLRHGDGSQSYYRHLKNGSVTDKEIGDNVGDAEYLGLVASSGNSTGPHLHFAARDKDENLIEPYAGVCNAQANGMTSWWENQKSYRDFAIVDLATHDALPTDPACPQPEDPNFDRLFSAGQTVIVGAYFRDATPSRSTTLSLRRPDGTTYASWSFSHPETRNSSSVYWQVDLPDILLATTRGRWELRGSYPSGDFTIVRERAFWVGALFADDFERPGLIEAGWKMPITLP